MHQDVVIRLLLELKYDAGDDVAIVTEPKNASIIALLEPASAVVFAAIILSQQITSTILVGGGLILLGALVVSGAGAMRGGA